MGEFRLISPKLDAIREEIRNVHKLHAVMLPSIGGENERWRDKHLPKLRALDEERQQRREALIAAIGRHPNRDDRELIMKAIL